MSSPDSTCIGAQDPPFGVPSIRMRAPSDSIIRSQVLRLTICIVARNKAAHRVRDDPHRLF